MHMETLFFLKLVICEHSDLGWGEGLAWCHLIQGKISGVVVFIKFLLPKWQNTAYYKDQLRKTLPL